MANKQLSRQATAVGPEGSWQPKVTVVVPAHNAASSLGRCLSHLDRSSLRPHERIVVDDGSDDETSTVAIGSGATLVRLDQRCGPAQARNEGARRAAGNLLFFIDSDVLVHEETLERAVQHFVDDPELDALIGSYDDDPLAENFVSQFEGLHHHFTHQTSRSQARTFWGACGVIRAEVFHAHGGFDSGFRKPSIEDVELGYRLSRKGHKILLAKEVQVAHLKRWTLAGLIRTEVLQRAVPWTRLILERRQLVNDLVLETGQRTSVVLASALPAVAVAGVLVPVWICAAAIGGLLIGIVGLNRGFYRFLVRRKGLKFAIGALPLHVLYFLYCGAGFAAGLVSHVWQRLTTRSRERGDGLRPVPRQTGTETTQ